MPLPVPVPEPNSEQPIPDVPNRDLTLLWWTDGITRVLVLNTLVDGMLADGWTRARPPRTTV